MVIYRRAVAPGRLTHPSQLPPNHPRATPTADTAHGGPPCRLRAFRVRTWPHARLGTRHDNHAVAVGHDHVARHHQHTAHHDRPIDRFDFIASGPNAAARLAIVQRNSLRLDLVRVARRATGDDAHATAHFPRHDVVRADRTNVRQRCFFNHEHRALAQQRHKRLRRALRVPLAHPAIELIGFSGAVPRLVRRHIPRRHGDADDAVS